MLRGLVAGNARPSVGPSARESVASVRSGRVSFAPNARPASPKLETRRLARAIAIASGKGGVGKSNIALNLGIELARSGRRVALFDADLGCANVDVLCGLPGEGDPRGRAAGATSTRGDRDEGPRHSGPGGLGLIPGASGVAELAALNAVQRQGIVEQLGALERVVDVLLIDVGAGIGADAIGFASAADTVLLTCTPEPTAMTDAYAAAKAIIAPGRRGRPLPRGEHGGMRGRRRGRPQAHRRRGAAPSPPVHSARRRRSLRLLRGGCGEAAAAALAGGVRDTGRGRDSPARCRVAVETGQDEAGGMTEERGLICRLDAGVPPIRTTRIVATPVGVIRPAEVLTHASHFPSPSPSIFDRGADRLHPGRRWFPGRRALRDVVENPLGAILARSLVTMVVCWPLGLVIGIVLDRLFREHVSNQTSQMEQEDRSAEEAGGDVEILDESEAELDSSGVDVAVASASDSA